MRKSFCAPSRPSPSKFNEPRSASCPAAHQHARWADWKLPLSFYLSTFGIQAQYFAPFAFTAFSVKIYVQKFGMSTAEAANLSGIMDLFGGLLGPAAGPFSDWLGLRAASLSFFGLFTVAGYALLAAGARTAGTVWAATVLFALTYGFGDTVAYPIIRLLVGAERVGIGYGIFGFMGGLFAVAVPTLGGNIFAAEASAPAADTGENVCWYFVGLAALVSAVWWCTCSRGPSPRSSCPRRDGGADGLPDRGGGARGHRRRLRPQRQRGGQREGGRECRQPGGRRHQ